MITPQDIFEKEIPAALLANPKVVKNLNAIVHFDLTGPNGGVWTLDATVVPAQVAQGAVGKPDLTMTINAADFVKIRQKKANPQMLMMQGKLKMTPLNIGLAMKLAQVLG
ncbi:MAG TPA: SCP2 sterol-binding domain-containing protein [Anaerolineae bacterium]|nr:SCP2 sterol-binding domain-containing protein [Anaerolineae bacterium]